MEIDYCEIAALPKLAWLAVVRPADGVARVIHGPYVEAQSRFFVEGVWSGEFSVGEFESTDCFFGSGAVSDELGITFVTSASTTDYLYYVTDQAGATISNSLPLLLAQIGDALDPGFAGYQHINLSIIRGIETYVRAIPTQHGEVKRLMYRNLRISAEGVREFEKRMPPSFANFADYAEYLGLQYGKIASNARDGARRHRLAILSTQSRGYDTTAVNAIAAKFGVDGAFTVSNGKVGGTFADGERGEGANDDGTDICAVLGIPCIQIDRCSYQREVKDEYLYYATLDNNQDFNLREVGDHITGAAVLLTGTLGEMWYTRESYESYIKKYDLVDDHLKRVDLGGHGLTEVRLAAGFVHLPFPYIGARRRRDVQTITESVAMDAWRLRNTYDRPIPRRLAEEGGVPRAMFGQTKIATVVQFAPPAVPYGRELREEYFAFLASNRLLQRWQASLFPIVHRVNAVLWHATEQRHRFVYYMQRAISKIIRREYRFALWWRRLDGSLFCFAVNRRAAEYVETLRLAHRL